MRRKLIVLVVMLCFWLTADAQNTTSDTSSSTPPVNAFNSSSANDSNITFSVPSSSVSSSPVVMETSAALPSMTSSSSSSSSPIDMSSSASTISAPLPTSQKAPVTSAVGPPKKSVLDTDTTYLPMVAAVISGCGLLVVMVILLVVMALVYRHIGKKDPMMTPLRKAKKSDGGLYTVQESQSAQYLVSSVSTPSFGNSPSDVRLDAHVPGSPGNMVYYNRGMDVDHRPAAGAYDPEDGYKPIQIVAADVPERPRSSTKV